MYKKIFNILNQSLLKIGKLASYLSFFLIFLVFFSVILRYLFSIGFTWLQDLYIWVHAAVILLGITFTLKEEGHVRIDLLYKKFSLKTKKIINFCGNIFFTLPIAYFITTKSYDYFIRSYLQNESSRESGGLPAIYILKFLIFVLGLNLLIHVMIEFLNFFKIKKRK